MKKQIRNFCVFLSSVLLLVSCYEPIKDCLNPQAENYNVLADEACDDCCDFPEITLRFNTLVGDSTYTRQDTFVDDFGNLFKLDQFEFFLDNIRLLSGEEETAILDSLRFSDGTGEVERLNDIVLYVFGKTSYQIGNFNSVATFDKIKFDFGLDIENLDFESLPVGNVLIPIEDSLYNNNRFYSNQIDVLSGDEFLNKQITSCTWPITSVELEFVEPVTSELGKDFFVTIPFDFSVWMAGINVLLDTQEEICNKLQVNMPAAFGL